MARSSRYPLELRRRAVSMVVATDFSYDSHQLPRQKVQGHASQYPPTPVTLAHVASW